MHPLRPRTGFTLTEMLVVVLVLAILATLVIPCVSGASRQAREAALTADLHVLHQAVMAFRADVGGYPLSLSHLMRGHAPRYAVAPGGKGLLRVGPGDFRGPYLTTGDGRLPSNPVTGQRRWAYDPRTGTVRSPAAGTGMAAATNAEW